MVKNLTPHSIAIGEENIYFLTPHFKYNKKEKIDDNELLKTNKGNVHPFIYHVSNCGKNSFKKLRIYKIHSNCDWNIYSYTCTNKFNFLKTGLHTSLKFSG